MSSCFTVLILGLHERGNEEFTAHSVQPRELENFRLDPSVEPNRASPGQATVLADTSLMKLSWYAHHDSTRLNECSCVQNRSSSSN